MSASDVGAELLKKLRSGPGLYLTKDELEKHFPGFGVMKITAFCLANQVQVSATTDGRFFVVRRPNN